MKSLLTIFCLMALAANAFAANGPEIQVIDGKVSIRAEGVPLSRLLRLLDSATGMNSKVPADLANRNLTVRFSGVDFDTAVRKIFEGQPLNYVVIAGKGIVVTTIAETGGAAALAGPAPFANNPSFPNQPAFAAEEGNLMNNQNFVNGQGVMSTQPMIQTPFGPMPDNRVVLQPGAPPMPPGPMQAPVIGTINPYIANPLNNAPPANAPSPGNSLFGNINPTPFQQQVPGSVTNPVTIPVK